MSYNKKQDFERFRKIVREKDNEIAILKQTINNFETTIENKYKNIVSTVDSTPAMIFVKDLIGNYIYANSSFGKILNLDISQIEGKCDFDLFETNSAKAMVLNDNQVKFEGKTIKFEETITLEERDRSFISIKSPLKNSNGEIIGVSGIAIDISDKARTFNSLTEREELLRTLIESTTDPIFLKDTAFQYKRVNRAMEKFTEKSRAFILGKNDEDLFEAEILRSLKEADVAVLGGSKHEEHFSKIVEDKTHYFHLIKVPIVSGPGNVTGICGVIRDITETKTAELKSSMLAKVIEQVGECVVITDLDGLIEYANPAFKEITGYAVEEAIGKNPRFLQSGDHKEEFYQDLWNTLTSGKTWRGVFHNKKKDGTLYHENAVIFPIKNHEGKIVKYAAIKMDLTFLDNLESLSQINIEN